MTDFKQFRVNRYGGLSPIKPRKPWSKEAKKARAQRRRSPVGRGGFSGADLRRVGDEQGWRCYWCGWPCETDYHVDHIQPLSKGGLNTVDNICIACPKCNLQKGAMTPDEWAGRSS